MTLSTDQIESLRPGFEASCGYGPLPLKRDAEGLYSPGIQMMWKGYLIAKSSPVLVTPEMVERGAEAAWLRAMQVERLPAWPTFKGEFPELHQRELENALTVLTAALNPGGE